MHHGWRGARLFHGGPFASLFRAVPGGIIDMTSAPRARGREPGSE